MSRKITGIGETILDIVFKDNKPVAAVPGGSTFNAIISLGRTASILRSVRKNWRASHLKRMTWCSSDHTL